MLDDDLVLYLIEQRQCELLGPNTRPPATLCELCGCRPASLRGAVRRP